MAMRNFSFAPGEYYHCCNRGVDKRTIFADAFDYFIKQLDGFNTEAAVTKLRLQKNKESVNPPVEILSYCLLPNHYHLLLRCNADQGVSQFMQRLGTGYTMYFNKKYKRSGSLFQGKFQANHIDTDQGLRQVAAYVYHNRFVHDISQTTKYRQFASPTNLLVRGLASDTSDDAKRAREVVQLIKDLRSARQDLAL